MTIIAICNQKGGVTETTTTINLGIGLAMQGKKVLLIDADPQGDCTTALGWDNNTLPVTLSTLLSKSMRDEPIEPSEGILHYAEGVDLVPSNLALSEMEMELVTAISREVVLAPREFSHTTADLSSLTESLLLIGGDTRAIMEATVSEPRRAGAALRKRWACSRAYCVAPIAVRRLPICGSR
jgi:cellulose biosynthesis protein BcsQ